MSDFNARLQAALGDAYRIERELGGGGMSRVFVATESALDRHVVIKVLPPDLAAGLNVDRFRREIQMAAKLQHPHIVPLLSAGSADGLLYYTMPLIEGESLRAKLAREGELPIAEGVRILREVADALAVPMEHERADRAGRLELLVNRQLLRQDLLEVDCEREHSAFVVLRRVRVQTDAAAVPIDVTPPKVG